MIVVYRSEAEIDHIDFVFAAPIDGFHDRFDVSRQRAIKNFYRDQNGIGNLFAYCACDCGAVPDVIKIVVGFKVVSRRDSHSTGDTAYVRMSRVDTAIDDPNSDALSGVIREVHVCSTTVGDSTCVRRSGLHECFRNNLTDLKPRSRLQTEVQRSLEEMRTDSQAHRPWSATHPAARSQQLCLCR